MAGSQEHVPLAQTPGMSNVNLQPQPTQTQYRGYQEVPSGQPSPGLSPGFKENMDLEEVRDWDALRQEDQILKVRIRRLRLILRISTLLLAIYMTTSMIISLHKYLSTRHIIIGGRNAWAKDTTTWPTILLLTTSGITLLVNAAIVVSYLRGISAANKTHDYASWLIAGVFFAHMGLWISTAILYRTGKTGHDLWGWSCSPKAQKIQGQFADVVNFNRYCNLQTGSWATSLAEAVLTTLAVFVYYLGYRRLRQRRVMKQYDVMDHRESRWSRMVPTKITPPPAPGQGLPLAQKKGRWARLVPSSRWVNVGPFRRGK